MKYALFFLKFMLCFTCVHFVSFAQQRDERNIFLPYSNFTMGKEVAPALNSANKIFIACLLKEDFAANKKSARFAVLRQLTDTVFILEVIDPVQNLFSFPLLPANNNWKLSPALLKEFIENKYLLPSVFLVTVEDYESFQKWTASNNIAFAKTTALNTYTVKINTVKD